MMALNVLLNNLYQLFWLNFVIYIYTAQWLTYQAYKPQIISSNPPGTLVHIFENQIFLSKLHFCSPFFFTLILLMHHAIFHNEVIYC